MELILNILTWFEQHLALALLMLLAAVNVLVLVVLVVYVRFHGSLPDGPLRDRLHKMVYEIDRACDALEKPANRNRLVGEFQQILGWRRFFIPPVILRWIIVIEVAYVRKLQDVAGIPDLHQEPSPGSSENPGGERNAN